MIDNKTDMPWNVSGQSIALFFVAQPVTVSYHIGQNQSCN